MHYCNWASRFHDRHTLKLPFSTFSETAWHAKRLGRNSLPQMLHWIWFLQASTSVSAVPCVYLQLATPNGGIWSLLTRADSLLNIFYLYHLALYLYLRNIWATSEQVKIKHYVQEAVEAICCSSLADPSHMWMSFRSAAVKSKGVPCSPRCQALRALVDVRKCGVRVSCAATPGPAAGAASVPWEGTVKCWTIFALERIKSGGKLCATSKIQLLHKSFWTDADFLQTYSLSAIKLCVSS